MEINNVYFSPYIKVYKCWSNIEKALNVNHISYGFLENTKDIWVRDFMPIKVAPNKFVFYDYNPNYLKGKDASYRTKDAHLCYDFSHADCVE